jgi:hypothetical protein
LLVVICQFGVRSNRYYRSLSINQAFDQVLEWAVNTNFFRMTAQQ